ncbi:MAG: cadmium-translocating P-type ATPase [Pseudomonadota bacterium]|jgi:P-type Cu2+ transporter
MSIVSTVGIASTVSAASNASAQSSVCFHCGLSVPAGTHWSVQIDDIDQPMCCPGCQAVAQTIVDNNLTDYYRTRQSLPESVVDTVPAALKLYDVPELAAQFNRAEGGAEAILSVEGIRCAACVWLIERRLARVPGLTEANLNVATEKLHVRWDTAQCQPSDILQAVHEVGYKAYPFDPIQHGELLRKNSRQLFKRWFVAGLSMMQVMMYAVPVYLTDEGGIEPGMAQLMRWASLLLTLPAVFYSAVPFFKGAITDLRARSLGMDVPVALGIAAAFIGSFYATLIDQGEVYFDSVTMFIFLLLGSRTLELIARRRAAASLEQMQHALPDAAWLLKDFPADRRPMQIAAAQLSVGDVVLVKPGETVPADGVILEGDTAIDLSLLTGESKPQQKQVGDSVSGGAVNVSAPITLRIDKLAKDSTLAALIRLIERAGQGKPKIAQWADRVAAWFVSALLLFAGAVWLFWQWHDTSRAWPIAIAVLVVSCPCALSLATPSALAAATNWLLRQGVLVIQPHVLETLHRATHIVFDKTGTLTEGRPVLRQTTVFGTVREPEALQIAAVLEAGSAHPIAHAFSHVTTSGLHATAIAFVQGQGIEGQIEGKTYRIGHAKFVAAVAGDVPSHVALEGMTEIYLGTEREWLARFSLADGIKHGAQSVIDSFKARGQRVILLSGDATDITQQVATTLAMDEAHGGMLPQQKMAFVQNLQQQGATVVMVGDGINDAAVLRVANVSFALGSGAALAQSHADAVLLSGGLSSLRDAVTAADACMRVIRQNLAWATLYNLAAIPAAAMGMLSPWMAGLGMSASSALVVLNALRLQRQRRA